MKIPFFFKSKTGDKKDVAPVHDGLEKIDKRILVAEDVEINQLLVKSLLEEWGCNVDIAVNGLEAVKKVKETDYDLILMDIQMPLMDGITATREIRNLPEPKENVIIIAFTSVDFKELEKYKEAGMDDYIIKPYIKENLHSKIVNLLKSQNSAVRKHRKLSDNKTVYQDDKSHPETGAENSLPANDLLKLYDTAMIDSIGKNNAAFTSKMIVMFVDVVLQDFDLLKIEAGNQNWKEVSQLAHKMKSTFGNMAVNSVLDNIKALEAGTTDPVGNVKQLEVKVEKVINQIKSDYPDLFKS
jgi:CheY-like chemotaxis protein